MQRYIGLEAGALGNKGGILGAMTTQQRSGAAMTIGNIIVERQRPRPTTHEGEGLWAGGWVDADGRMRELRAELEPYIPRASLRAVAAAANLDYAQYSRLEQGQKAWMVPTFARVAGGLLGTLEWYERRPMPLHTIFPDHQPRRSRPESFSPTPVELPTAPASPPFCWNLHHLLDRLTITTGTPWILRDLAARLAEAEGNPSNAKTIFTVLDRIQRGLSDGSLPTLLRLHRFLSPFLTTPTRPFLLDDILTIHRWRIVIPARA